MNRLLLPSIIAQMVLSLRPQTSFPVKSFEESFVFQVFQQREVKKLGGLSSLEIGISVTQILYIVLERLLPRIGFCGDCPQQVIFMDRLQQLWILDLQVLAVNPHRLILVRASIGGSLGERHDKSLQLPRPLLQELAA